MRPAVALLALLAFTGLSASRAADEAPKATPYYPLKIGTKWTYKAGGGSLTLKVAKHEKVGDAVCGLLETYREDQLLTSEHIGVKDDGIYRYSIGGMKPDNPLRILKLPAKKGDSWKVNSKIGGQTIAGTFTAGEEEVTVPAGKYKAVTVVSDGFEVPDGNGNMLKLVFRFWFAEKVGMVKQTIRIGDLPEVVIELEKYEAP